MLSRSELRRTAAAIARVQLPSGMIPWAPRRHGDPWNHAEAVAALALGGELAAAERGLDWLAGVVARDGAFCQYYLASGVEEPRIDLNVCAYPIVAIVAWVAAGGSVATARAHLAWYRRTLELVLGHQLGDGRFPWALDPGRRPLEGSLRAGSAAMVIALDGAAWAANELGVLEAGPIEEARSRLALAIAKDEGFLDRFEWSMDWYYPVLAGVLELDAAEDRLDGLFERARESTGQLRCVLSAPWVTTAETAEAAMAAWRLGRIADARALLASVESLREPDGSYRTGIVVPEGHSFPTGECSTYSAAAVVLAHHVLRAPPRAGLIEALVAAS
ncbi:conserved hypothetical protein [Acidimicrobium ferrooxidans DSM 10331]|uniref:Prenyltransferase n=1 Tax=Acidimicrobium ferrooxidans (strain DSM 10331 / JCM 15462 / NBRC 103882 / ICP) TaxID=525909 RepID=C7M364_ACIFD|nr:hypothetical protein [Acidimicrobium ferrooxidans]ACU53458.1 conserved hypothetical protein [Acidimicrobium ferrooxidans DSM 10331]